MPTSRADAPSVLRIAPWADQLIEMVGHDPRSTYVETFWLGLLGPSTTWFLRRIALGFDDEPEGFALPVVDTAVALGLGRPSGPRSTFMRAIERACRFGMAQRCGPEALAVRRKLPSLTQHQLDRLPDAIQDLHRHWHGPDRGEALPEHRRERVRRLALSLLELGETIDATERQLHRWHVHPALARDAVRWAGDHLHRAPAHDADPG